MPQRRTGLRSIQPAPCAALSRPLTHRTDSPDSRAIVSCEGNELSPSMSMWLLITKSTRRVKGSGPVGEQIASRQRNNISFRCPLGLGASPSVWYAVSRTLYPGREGASPAAFCLGSPLHDLELGQRPGSNLPQVRCHSVPPCWARSVLMSSDFHAVIRGPSLCDAGNRPDLTPAHHVLRLTGNRARICGSLTNPASGSGLVLSIVRSVVVATRNAFCLTGHHRTMGFDGSRHRGLNFI